MGGVTEAVGRWAPWASVCHPLPCVLHLGLQLLPLGQPVQIPLQRPLHVLPLGRGGGVQDSIVFAHFGHQHHGQNDGCRHAPEAHEGQGVQGEEKAQDDEQKATHAQHRHPQF